MLPKKKLSPLAIVLLLSAGFFFIFLIISGVMFMKAGPGTWQEDSKTARLFNTGGAVGLIEVKGVIMDSKITLKQLDSFAENDLIKAVVIRLNTPGGSVGPSQEIYEALKKYPKPVIASMGSVAASGGYYIACGAQKVYANAGTITGSIGVIMEFANLKGLYEWAKIKRYALTTGKFKNAGAEYKDMSQEERDLLQGMIDDVLGQFKAAVQTGRKMKASEVDAIADGRIFSGAQAKKRKLVDEIGTLQDAIDEAGRVAKIDGKPQVVTPGKKREKLLEFLMDNSPEEESRSPSSLSTWLGQLAFRLTGHSASSESLPGLLAPGLYWIWDGGV